MTLTPVTLIVLAAASTPIFVALALVLLLTVRPAASLREAAEALAIVIRSRRRGS